MSMRTAVLVFLTLGAQTVTASAQDGTDDSSTGSEEQKAKKDKKDKAEDKAASKAGEKAAKAEVEPLDISGRVFARSELESVDSGPWLHELKLDSARIGASYRWKDKIRVKAAMELAGTPEVKDAYVDVDGPNGFDVRGGYFKVPISVIENASAWDLSNIDRGVISQIIEDGLGLSGRRDGVMVDWEPAAGNVKLGLMLSQSAAVTGQDPSRPLEDGGGLMVTARGELQLCPCLRLGVHVSNRETNYIADVHRYWAGGIDAELDLESIGKGLRLWADVIAGEDHFYAVTRGEERVTFVTAQAVAGWRFGGEKKNATYVEPFVGGGYFNPHIALKRDEIMDAMFGVNAGRWKRWRVQAQLEVVTAKALRPGALSGEGDDINDQIKGILQLGSAF
jgi:hypothetical protein